VIREVTLRLLTAVSGRIVNISVRYSTMQRAGFSRYGPSRSGSEALSRVMAADLRGARRLGQPTAHDERIVATGFEGWLRDWNSAR